MPACILLYSLRAVRELTATTFSINSSSPEILLLEISILERESARAFSAAISCPEEPVKSISSCSSMASMASSISSMASSQSMGLGGFQALLRCLQGQVVGLYPRADLVEGEGPVRGNGDRGVARGGLGLSAVVGCPHRCGGCGQGQQGRSRSGTGPRNVFS